ncbi:MAG: DUF1566 domain-containing protein [Candidatus Cloacimonetes bacterium]|nr:DUF1566 domain-containing protein [Candidatus Cloacimonadota bacterium]
MSHTSAHNSILQIQNASDDPASEANIQFAAGSPAHGRATISATHDTLAGTYNGNLSLEVRNGTTSYLKAITMRSSGNVGIGNEDPSEKLSVSGMVESTTGGFKFPDGTIQTAAATGSATYSIGDFAQAGIVFWLDETGEHGLVCAKTDQSAGVRWHAGTLGDTQAKGDGPYAGEANTAIIIAAQVAIGDDGATYAARICNELQITEGGKTYGDWYLPSKEELNLMYQNIITINTTATANGGSAFAAGLYWSSTQHGGADAWAVYFPNGLSYYYPKHTICSVRAIRSF